VRPERAVNGLERLSTDFARAAAHSDSAIAVRNRIQLICRVRSSVLPFASTSPEAERVRRPRRHHALGARNGRIRRSEWTVRIIRSKLSAQWFSLTEPAKHARTDLLPSLWLAAHPQHAEIAAREHKERREMLFSLRSLRSLAAISVFYAGDLSVRWRCPRPRPRRSWPSWSCSLPARQTK
jgi:hypothetical protein